VAWQYLCGRNNVHGADISAKVDEISSKSNYDPSMPKRHKAVDGVEHFYDVTHEVTALLAGARSSAINEVLDECLRTVGEHFGADQVGLGQWSTSGEILPALRAWGPKPIGDYLTAVPPGLEARAQIRRKGFLIWNCLEDLEGLPQFQEHCRQVGAMAGAFSLHRDFGSHTDHLAMAKTDPGVWPEETVKCQAAIGEVLFNALYRRRAEVKAEQLHRLQVVISDVTAKMVCMKNDSMDVKIDNALEQIGKVLDADLCVFLLSNNPNTSIYEANHEWVVDAVGGPNFAGVILADNYPWLIRQLEKKKRIRFANSDNFAPEAPAEVELFERTGIQTMVWEPFKVADGTCGYLGLASVNREREWSDGIITLLGFCGNIIGDAIAHQHAHLALEQAFNEIEALKENLAIENETLRQEVSVLYADDELIGKSHAFRTAIYQAEQVAPTDSTALLLGETGTGKGLLARRIHERSGRSHRPLITVNCAALPSTLIESELFGHEKGAFTGAINRKIGRFELADGGTIFLDEVGDLPTELQAKLLRVLQDQEFERLGSSTTITVDVRVIAATNRDLDQLIEQGEFRADLYYRLGVFPIRAPALRERRGDIPLLVWFFISELQNRLGKSFDEVSARAMDALTAYDWPGNVRELRNIIERAMILSPGTALKLDNWFPGNAEFTGTSSRTHDRKSETIAEVERAHIEKVLQACDWKIRGKDGAAEYLGLKRTTLQSRMKKLGIDRPRA
jgi:transcriptional regulator with GAF, ATPase, and Fis domain